MSEYGEEKMAAFSGALDRHPALKGKQSQLPDKIQVGIIKKKLRMRKQAASTESQLLQALSAEGGAAGMKALRKRVKEDDLEKALRALIASGRVRRHPDGDIIKESAATATKTDPAKWEAAKREAKSKMGGKHSARAMQLATQIYKKKGGGYSGAKPTSQNNSLKKWGKQKWGYSGKDKPGQGGSGVYLPEKKRQRLKSTAEGRKRLRSASRKKSEATRKGQQYSSHGLASGASLKKSASYSAAKEAAASKDPRLARAGVSGYNQAKRTPGHPTKSHIVVAKEGDKVRTIRFGQQGVRTNQTAGQREAFKSRHRKNISRGRMSAAYWADKAKWSPKKTKDKDNPKWVKGS